MTNNDNEHLQDMRIKALEEEIRELKHNVRVKVGHLIHEVNGICCVLSVPKYVKGEMSEEKIEKMAERIRIAVKPVNEFIYGGKRWQ